MTRLAIFDCDGTLVDSGATIHGALVEAFESHGVQLPPARECRKVIGLSLTQAMAALLPDADDRDHHQLAETYKACFQRARREGRIEEPLFDGITELLDALDKEGWLLAVATGKSDRGLKHCLDSHGLTDRFVSLQTADRHPSKPAPHMALAAMAQAGASGADTIVIGDTSFDIAMAVAAGAAGIGAAWGYHDVDELLGAGASAIAESPADVLRHAREAANG